MCGSRLAVFFIALTAAALAQTPPVGAKDITQMPPATPSAAAAPSATIAAPASVIRVYVDNLSGSDASLLAGLITQTLFQSKQVVVTEDQSNASLILKGTVLRQPIATASASTHSPTTHRSRAAAHASASGTSPDGLPVTSLDSAAANTAPVLPADGAELPADAADLPPLPMLDAPTDLTRFRYRLDLQVINPSGDLVWMSGRGAQALPFQDADDAVSRTIQPLLDTISQMKPSGGQ